MRAHVSNMWPKWLQDFWDTLYLSFYVCPTMLYLYVNVWMCRMIVTSLVIGWMPVDDENKYRVHNAQSLHADFRAGFT